MYTVTLTLWPQVRHFWKDQATKKDHLFYQDPSSQVLRSITLLYGQLIAGVTGTISTSQYHSCFPQALSDFHLSEVTSQASTMIHLMIKLW